MWQLKKSAPIRRRQRGANVVDHNPVRLCARVNHDVIKVNADFCLMRNGAAAVKKINPCHIVPQ